MKPMIGNAVQMHGHARAFEEAYAVVLRPLCAELSLPQNALDILLFLANNPGYDTARDICLYRRLKPGIVSLHVESLAREGYLERRPVPGDRRKCGLRCTELAQPIIREGQALQQSFMQQIAAGMTEADLEVCLRCIRTMEANLARMAGE